MRRLSAAGVVLFKPTLTFGDQTFRLDNEGASTYFIGGDPKKPDDARYRAAWSDVKPVRGFLNR